jgi:pimeloyl-ACP methyl ester carboxylesterase
MASTGWPQSRCRTWTGGPSASACQRFAISFDLSSLADTDVAIRMFAPGPMGFIDRLPEPGALPDWLSADEFDYYVTEFARTGFTGALNWYRNFDKNWEILANPATATIAVPTMCILGTNDPTQGFTPRDRAAEVVTGPYREVILDGAGHWLHEERANEVSAELVNFLACLQRSDESHGNDFGAGYQCGMFARMALARSTPWLLRPRRHAHTSATTLLRTANAR